MATPSSSTISLTASTLSDGPLTALQTALSPYGWPVLDAWTLSTTGTFGANDPAYLSLSIPSQYSYYSRDTLHVWSSPDGTTWSQIDPNDLTFDGNYASFTVNANLLNGYSYAVVPEPTGLLLVAAGLAGLLAYAWRKRK